MKILFLFLFVNIILTENCLTVLKGNHRAIKIPFEGFRNNNTINFKSKFRENSSKYLFPKTEVSGQRCQTGFTSFKKRME
jgi:hypothetical protein